MSKGLKPEHHGELNHLGVTRERFLELRAQYATDERALRQIDVYDRGALYHQMIDEYRQSFKRHDIAKQARLEKWFKKHGYNDL